jgi:hypothetical protein
MKRFYRGAAIAALGLLVSRNGHAATLYTPPATASFTSEILGCRVINLGKTTQSVQIQVRNYIGSILDSYTYSVAPNHTASSADVPSGSYCKATFSGSKKSVRLAAEYFTIDGTVTTTIPARTN